jgi:ABC-2 type transport system permease protein
MNIYRHEFLTRIRSVAIWSVSIAALIFVFTSISTGFTEKAELLNQMMANFPPQLLQAFGMTEMDFSSILGYFGLIFLFCQICLGIQAANYSFGLVSIEESEFTADFLLAKPVNRSFILTAKLLSAFTSLTITNAVVWASTFFFLSVYDTGTGYDVNTLVILLASITVFQLVFLGLGVFISLLVKRVRSVTPFSMALVFGTYTFNAFSGMLGEKSLDLLTPFKHFDPNFIVKNSNWDWPLVAISIGFIVVSIPASYWLYNRRNIPSAV